MGIECCCAVAAPRTEVFAWHSRPGAFTRLAPPWQPVRIESEATSLADGVAVLRLPGGLRWVAEHQAADYDPPHRFTDRLVTHGLASAPIGVLPWRHIHDFEEQGPNRTLVSDRVETPIPAAMLRPLFDYRHRQLIADLAAHRDATAHGYTPATIAITGSSGLVGTALTAFLRTGGHTVVPLVRGPAGPGERHWNPDAPAPGLLDGIDAVVHLAGASIAGRFTEAHKRAVADSRIAPTERLAARAAEADVPVFVSASAVGYYGADRGDDTLDETSSRGEGFVADLVDSWETAADAAGAARIVKVRTGIVQSPRGGTLRLLRPLFSAGLGGRIGSGRGWLPWIGLDDLVDIYHRALWDRNLSGPVDAVAPHPVRNIEYTATLARVLHRPALLPIPSFAPALLLGAEGATELATASQRVLPTRLQSAGHRFRTPDLEPALRHLFGRTSG
ncbi:TIGR01777 family oxidoreductase [Nocardia sp. alder85J]|uniref:TIGR01777 family oxidoreductase n=1 Tax=Nocardia sp. alder85J TaxID=2862949 RepID=UPI001CD4AE61|nr:TIGR01777 family oxidoreductase [Nocardia sp. alder85J]MCX4098167.1 TIGR01777 family oxidoreductase [Nocardia sp. alder85J]